MNSFVRLAVVPAFALSFFSTVALSASPASAPLAPRDAGCFGKGGFIEGCKGAYDRERDGLNVEIPSLKSQALVAQEALDKNQNILLRYVEIITNEKTLISNLNRDIPEKERVVTALEDALGAKLDEAKKELDSISNLHLEGSGKLLVSLRGYISSSLAGVASRLVEIDSELLSDQIQSSERDALNYEKRVLLRIQSAVGANLKPGEFEGLISKIRSGSLSVQASKLPADLVALIAAVIQTEERQLKEKEISSLVSKKMTWVEAKLSSLKDEMAKSLANAKKDRNSLAETLATNEAGYSEWREYLNSQMRVRDFARSRNAQLEARFAEIFRLRECCDDHPYCRSNGLEQFENRVRDRPNDDCR